MNFKTFIFMYVMSSALLCGMNRNYDFVMEDNCDFAMWQAVIPNSDLIIQRQLAVLNHAYNKYIENNYRRDKKAIENVMQEKGISLIPCEIVWNKNFTACTWITTEDSDNSKEKVLEFNLLSIVNKKVEMYNGRWDRYICQAVQEKNYPFFNRQGDACFYGYGKIGCGYNIIEYSVKEGISEAFECDLFIDKNINLWLSTIGNVWLRDFIGFPTLLKAILYSRNALKKANIRKGRACARKRYKLDNVIVPVDYQNYVKQDCLVSYYYSFDEIPKWIRNAFIQKYEEQQCEKVIENT